MELEKRLSKCVFILAKISGSLYKKKKKRKKSLKDSHGLKQDCRFMCINKSLEALIQGQNQESVWVPLALGQKAAALQWSTEETFPVVTG